MGILLDTGKDDSSINCKWLSCWMWCGIEIPLWIMALSLYRHWLPFLSHHKMQIRWGRCRSSG